MTIFASNDSSVQAKSIKSNTFMKKHYSLLLAFLVAFSSFFVSCDENDDFEDSPYNMLSLMLFFIEDYYENGVYTKTQDVLEINGHGDIDWNRTINQEFPIIQNGKPYYTELQTRYHQKILQVIGQNRLQFV